MHYKPECLCLKQQTTKIYIYLYHRMPFGRPHSGVCSVPDIWHIYCYLCTVHNWLCRAGRHSDPCQDTVPAGNVSDSDLGGGNVPVHFRLQRRSTQNTKLTLFSFPMNLDHMLDIQVRLFTKLWTLLEVKVVCLAQ